MSEPCQIRHASDGTPVRINGQISQEQLDAITAQVRARLDSRCKAESTKAMPEVAQRLHGRTHYHCDREKGHDGPHRWPDRTDRDPIVEWEDA